MLAEKMKIFNWVQRRFNYVILKDISAQSVERAEEFASGAAKQASLKQVALVDVLQGWKDGILTNRTLGFDPVTTSNQQNRYFILGCESEKEVEGEDDKEDDEQEKQITLESVKDKDLNYDGDDQTSLQDEEEEEEEVNPLLSARNKMHAMSANSYVPENNYDPKKTKKGERVTLAQLFVAESNDMAKEKENFGGADQIDHAGKEKSTVRSKEGMSFAKKLIAHGREDSRLVKKLNRLMRNMLKSKIHPELGHTGCKKGDQSEANMDAQLWKKGKEASESIFLLRNSSGATIVSFD